VFSPLSANGILSGRSVLTNPAAVGSPIWGATLHVVRPMASVSSIMTYQMSLLYTRYVRAVDHCEVGWHRVAGVWGFLSFTLQYNTQPTTCIGCPSFMCLGWRMYDTPPWSTVYRSPVISEVGVLERCFCYGCPTAVIWRSGQFNPGSGYITIISMAVAVVGDLWCLHM